MSMLRRFDPVGEMLSLRDAISQLMADAVVGPAQESTRGTMGMALNLRETDDAYIVEAVLPGLRPDEIDVAIRDNVLVINAESRQENTDTQQGTVHRIERRYGRFSRALTLPSQVDPARVQATLENGILRLQIPKAEQAKPRRIAIQGGEGTQTQLSDTTPQSDGQPAQDGQAETAAGGQDQQQQATEAGTSSS
jgi:HSP20 family protein